jgi:putative hydrolase of the HAD superfamily
MPFRPLGGRFLRENAAVTRAVLLDALGTLVELEPPWEPLARGLGTAPDERLRQAVRAEMAYYREHSHEGRDAASLTELRQRCAAVLSREAGRDVPVGTMMAAIRFRAFPDAAPALAGLRELGLRLVCVSNWDVSLSGVLESCGLGDALDRVVTSAEAGAEEAVHVGDTPEDDLAGAAAAGIRALLIARDGSGDIASLGEIGQHLDP